MQWWGERRIEDRASIERVAQTGLLIMYDQKALPDRRKDGHEMRRVRSKQQHERQWEEYKEKLFAVKRVVETHPAAPVMMAFLPLRRSPRFVLAMLEQKTKHRLDQRR